MSAINKKPRKFTQNIGHNNKIGGTKITTPNTTKPTYNNLQAKPILNPRATLNPLVLHRAVDSHAIPWQQLILNLSLSLSLSLSHRSNLSNPSRERERKRYIQEGEIKSAFVVVAILVLVFVLVGLLSFIFFLSSLWEESCSWSVRRGESKIREREFGIRW